MKSKPILTPSATKAFGVFLFDVPGQNIPAKDFLSFFPRTRNTEHGDLHLNTLKDGPSDRGCDRKKRPSAGKGKASVFYVNSTERF